MFVETLGLNPNEILSKDALAMPNRTIVDSESHQIKVLNEALKHAILKELRNAWQKGIINSGIRFPPGY